MRRALIGHTGFVGSNLNQQCEYSHCYNSKNIGDIKGEHFEEIVCAGIQASNGGLTKTRKMIGLV